MLSAVTLSFIMLGVIILNAIMLNVVLLNVILLNVIMLIVVAPFVTHALVYFVTAVSYASKIFMKWRPRVRGDLDRFDIVIHLAFLSHLFHRFVRVHLHGRFCNAILQYVALILWPIL